jgi:hypothetical protein
MITFQKWLKLQEARSPSSSSQVNAIIDMVDKLKGVFKKYTPTTRKSAWNKLISPKGRKEIKRLLTSPKLQFTKVIL